MDRRNQSSSLIKHRARELRRNMTHAELHLWSAIRQRQLNGFKFRRQHPLDHFIIDFICLEAHLIIEIDGGQHATSDADQERTKWLAQKGFRILRFWNNDVLNNRAGVLMMIEKALEK